MALLLGILLGVSGCLGSPAQDNTLTIATTWPAGEQKRLEEGFRQWLANPSQTAPPIAWRALAPGDDPGLVARGRPTADLLIGGPASSYRRMARDGTLRPADGRNGPAWLAIRRSPVGWVTHYWKGTDFLSTRTFDDPRRDPRALEWVRGVLSSGAWSDGYAGLVGLAGGPRRIGRQAGSALAALERDEVIAAPGLANDLRPPLDLEALDPPIDSAEGAAIVADTRHAPQAQAFLNFLVETGEAEAPRVRPGDDAEADSLLADLLGATLVDAQDELWVAWSTLRKSSPHARGEAWMTQAPPWPPASVAKLAERDGSGALVHSLAEQIVPEPAARAWLLQSWLAPERPIDGTFLAELARVAEGRLAREPRFRAWLRAEWTAWARQRYRRVARQAREAPA